VGGIGRRTGYISASAFEGRFGRDYFHFMRSSWGASWLRRRSCSQDARARPRGVKFPGKLLKPALELLSPEPQPGPRRAVCSPE
jgi:hypothetical protein